MADFRPFCYTVFYRFDHAKYLEYTWKLHRNQTQRAVSLLLKWSDVNSRNCFSRKKAALISFLTTAPHKTRSGCEER